jgi:hypothetical protein
VERPEDRTLLASPTTTTLPAANVSSTMATLSGSVNPEGNSTATGFQFSTDPSLPPNVVTTLAGLANTSGSHNGTGNSATFGIPSGLAVDTMGNIYVADEGQETIRKLSIPRVYAQSGLTGTSDLPVSAALTGLTPNTTYYYRVVANNIGGPAQGSIESFTTRPLPVAMSIAAIAGSPQTTPLNTGLGAALQALVLDQNGNGLAGANVTFTAPAEGPSGTFPGGVTTVTVPTDPSGTAAAPPLTANGIVSSYTVTATVAGVATQASFRLTNKAAELARIALASDQFTANATDGSAAIVLTREGNPSATVTAVLTSGGGSDVAPFTQTVTFGPGTTSATVSVPLQNDGQPGESDVSVDLSLVSPSDGAALGETTSATLVVHDSNPLPPPVTVTSIDLQTIRVATGSGKKRRTVSEPVIRVHYSAPIYGPGSLDAYRVLTGATRKGTPAFTRPVPLVFVNYDAATLIPRSKLNLAQPEQLTLDASLLYDNFSRYLDGHHDGQPGGNFVATFSKKGIQIERLRGSREVPV